MFPKRIELDGRECYDIGWAIIRRNWPHEKGADQLFMKPLEDEADKWGACYISTQSGNCQGIYYVMKAEDARRFVMDKRTSGVTRGHPWSYFWTTISNFIQRGGIAQVRFTHDTGKMDPVLKDLGITPLKKEEIEELLGRLRYTHPHDVRGLCPGVVYEIDGNPVDIDIDRPRDIPDLMNKMHIEGHTYRAAICDGWVDMHSNLGVEALWKNWVTVTYDNRYR